MRTLVSTSPEKFVPSKDAVLRHEFIRLGLTDSVLLEFISIQTEGPAPTLLAADFELAYAAETNGCLVENFNHWRENV